jgi:defect-in-organelle-trafficking protein DotB
MSDIPQDTQEQPVQPGFMRAEVPEGELIYPGEPHRFSSRDGAALLVWATLQGASDITIQSDEQVFAEIYGKMHRITRRALSNAEVIEIATGLYESETAKKELSDRRALDFAFTAKPERHDRYRFRINATSLTFDGQRGVQITARTIPSIPPTIDDVKLEAEIRPAMAPKQGLVVITGATGSGKSTLLAAIIRSLCEDPNGHRKIITYEAPIEYVYDEVQKPTTIVSQHEIGSHLVDFVEAVRNALRRKPSIILVGEARDAETIGEAITASLTGHLVYTTVHSNGFSATIPRMVNVFPKEERNARATDIVSSMRLCLSQRLVPSTDGKRIALREYVIFNDDIVDEILASGADDLTLACRKVLRKYGRSFLQDAQEKFDRGLISQHTLDEIKRSARGDDRDAASIAFDIAQRHQQAVEAMEVIEGNKSNESRAPWSPDLSIASGSERGEP